MNALFFSLKAQKEKKLPFFFVSQRFNRSFIQDYFLFSLCQAIHYCRRLQQDAERRVAKKGGPCKNSPLSLSERPRDKCVGN